MSVMITAGLDYAASLYLQTAKSSTLSLTPGGEKKAMECVS